MGHMRRGPIWILRGCARGEFWALSQWIMSGIAALPAAAPVALPSRLQVPPGLAFFCRRPRASGRSHRSARASANGRAKLWPKNLHKRRVCSLTQSAPAGLRLEIKSTTFSLRSAFPSTGARRRVQPGSCLGSALSPAFECRFAVAQARLHGDCAASLELNLLDRGGARRTGVATLGRRAPLRLIKGDTLTG